MFPRLNRLELRSRDFSGNRCAERFSPGRLRQVRGEIASVVGSRIGCIERLNYNYNKVNSLKSDYIRVE